MFLIFGKSGWIGGLVGELLKKDGYKFEYANARLEDRATIVSEIERVRAVGAEMPGAPGERVRVRAPVQPWPRLGLAPAPRPLARASTRSAPAPASAPPPR